MSLKAQREVDEISKLTAPIVLRRSNALLDAWHLASLDAPTVAVVWSLGFAWVAKIRLPGWVPVFLALVTWTVYVGDRLLDARSAMRAGDPSPLRERHFFHWRHRQVLVPLAVGATLAAACLILARMPRPFLERNSILAAATLAYFTGVHSTRQPRTAGTRSKWLRALLTKEFLVGFLFTAGCLLGTLSRAAKTQVPELCGIGFYYALLAWLNCFAIQTWEAEIPATAGRTKTSSIRGLGLALGLSGIAIACAAIPISPRVAEILGAGAVGAILLAQLDKMRYRFTPVTCRACTDLALLVPLLLLAA